MTEPRTEAGRAFIGDYLGDHESEMFYITRDDMADRILAIETEAGELDAAWSEAEAALPEGWPNHITLGGPHGMRSDSYYLARAATWTFYGVGPEGYSESGEVSEVARASGPTPAAARQALADRLREPR